MLKLKGQDDMSNEVKKPTLPREENRADEAWEELLDSYQPLSIMSDDKRVSDKPTENGAMNTVGDSILNESVNNVPSEPVEKKDNPILSVLFLIGFFAYLGLFYVTSQIEPKLAMSVFGSLWLLISIVCIVSFIKDGIKDMKNVIIAFIFMYLGVGLTFVPLLQMYVPTFQGQFGFSMAMYLVFVFCIILGVLLDGIELYQMIRAKMVCTVPVQAMCLKLRDKYFWRDEVSVDEAKGYKSIMIAPGAVGFSYRTKAVRGIFQFDYKGQIYEVEDNINSGFDHPTPEKVHTLYINPENPKEFYRHMPMTHLGIFIVGTAFMAAGIICCVLF